MSTTLHCDEISEVAKKSFCDNNVQRGFVIDFLGSIT